MEHSRSFGERTIWGKLISWFRIIPWSNFTFSISSEEMKIRFTSTWTLEESAFSNTDDMIKTVNKSHLLNVTFETFTRYFQQPYCPTYSDFYKIGKLHILYHPFLLFLVKRSIKSMESFKLHQEIERKLRA